MTTVPFRTSAEIGEGLDRVVRHLEAGGLIAYPTETVYGFGCALRPDALAALAALKRRSERKPFLVLVADATAVPGVQWTDAARRLADRFWPGPLTLALRAVPAEWPREVVSAAGTVAVRASPHAAPAALVRALRTPITSTSANAPGRPPARTAADVAAAVHELAHDGADVWLLDGGALPDSAPSTLVDCSTVRPRLVRRGAIGENELRHVLEEIDVG